MRNQKKIIEVIEGLGFRKHTSNQNLWFKPTGAKDKYGVDMSGIKPVVFKFEGMDHITDETEPVIKETMDAINAALKTKPKEEPTKEEPAEEKPAEELFKCELCGDNRPVSEKTPVGVPESHYVCKECTEKITSGKIKVDNWFKKQDSIAVGAIPAKPNPTDNALAAIAESQETHPEPETNEIAEFQETNPTVLQPVTLTYAPVPTNLINYSDEQIETIKNTVAKGISTNELDMFIHLCKTYGLDPFLKEIFYSPQMKTIMTSRDGYLKIAQRDPRYDGLQSMAVCENDIFEIDAVTPTVIHKFGQGDRGKVIGAWAIVHKKGCRPVISYADIREYKKSNPVWNTYTSAMICKVAEVFSLKRQYGISGLVTQEELV